MATHLMTWRKTGFHRLRTPHVSPERRVWEEHCWRIRMTRLQCFRFFFDQLPYTSGPNDVYKKTRGESTVMPPDPGGGFCHLEGFVLLFYFAKSSEIPSMSPEKF